MHRHRILLACSLLSFLSRAAAGQGAVPPYRDPALAVDERVRDLLGRMTPEEKFWQLFMIPGDLDDSTHDYSHGVFGLQIRMADTASAGAARGQAERINAIQRYFVDRTRLGIPIIPFEEGVHGLVAPGATIFPQAIALAATWDTALVARVATAIAAETRSRGIRQVLSPVLNIASDVRWGRVEETYGEDPYLVSRMGIAFVGAFERAGVIATPKHFIANVGEGGRDSYPVDLGTRELEERFFPPFRAAIEEGHAGSVMTAYNAVNGVPATQNRMLLTEVLKKGWGFGGFVISDAAATGGPTVLQHTEANTAAAAADALNAGLDVIFQSSWEQYRPYFAAFRQGLIPGPVIDSAVARVLRAKFALGLFEHPYVDADSAAYWNGHPDHTALAAEAARASIVLLQNAHAVLPFRPSLRSIAVIGTDAVEARLGGYSGPGLHPMSILDGIRARAGGAVVRYAPGPGRVTTEYVTIPAAELTSDSKDGRVRGLRGEYFDGIDPSGVPTLVRTDSAVDFHWTLSAPDEALPVDWYSVRWSGTVTVPIGGVRRIGIEGNDGYRLFVDGHLLIDDWRKRSFGTQLREVGWPAGSRHELRLEYFEDRGGGRVRLVWDAGVRDDWRGKIDSAAAVARRSEVAVIVAGIEEGEFRDRASLALPGHQEELIEAVAKTGRPVVVVLVGGSAVTMSRWIDRVDGIVDAWYPGEQGGRAVAEVLFGDTDPAGRLPVTFPIAEGQLPLYYDHKPTGRGDDYLDLTGLPLFPFGFGLSYTTFGYADLAVTPDTADATATITVHCRVSNTGLRAGDEVAQLYLRDLLASAVRPVLQLAGFKRIHLAPGESREVSFRVTPDQLRMLDRDLRWTVEPGDFQVLVGSSSADIRLRGAFTVR